MTLPTLYKKTSTGKIQLWQIKSFVSGHRGGGNPIILTTYGQLGGKLQEAVEVITEGKNIGKVNETTPLEQAHAEAKSQWEQKVKKGYVENIEDAEQGKIDTNAITGGVDPMLAHTYEKQGHKIKYPAYVQPKLDGHRCIAIVQDGVCTLWSRTRKPIKSMPHIAKQLEALVGLMTFDGPIIFDGELYNHDYRDKFEELTSKIKQDKPTPGGEVVQYWIYDVVTDMPFSVRAKMLKGLQDKLTANKQLHSITTVSTTTVDSEEEMISIFGTFMNYYFEGLMVRNADGLYKNKRSYDLQKVKVMQDAEFPIVGVKEGKGKMAGKAIFICETLDGKEFSAKMVGALDNLIQYFEDDSTWKDKMLTVKFQNYSTEGVPRFPVAMRIREDI